MGLRNNNQGGSIKDERYQPKPKRKAPANLPHREFVKVWMEANNTTHVADTFGVSISQVSAKANYLRKIGVKLPHMTRQRDYNSVDELNKIISKHTKGK